MNTELATAMAQETVDAIRRAVTPLRDEISRLQQGIDGDLADKMEKVEGRLDQTIATAIKDGVAALASAFETMRADLEQKRGPPGDGFHYRDVFDADADYVVGDWVTHDGTLWAARAPSKGMTPGTPAASASWRMAMKRARDGANGVGWNWRGAYTDGEAYRVNDVARFMGRVFLCRRATANAPPVPGGALATEWALVLE